MGSENLSMLWHDYFLVKNILKGGNNSLVQRRSAEKHDSLADPPLFHYAVEVVVDDGVAKSGDQILQAGAFLSIRDQVRFHEHGAAFGQIDGAVGRQGNVLELSDDVYA